MTGPMFTTLHTMFETQYTELALAIDEIAERIRALGAFSDQASADLATRRLDIHQKHAWMLRSHLE